MANATNSSGSLLPGSINDAIDQIRDRIPDSAIELLESEKCVPGSFGTVCFPTIEIVMGFVILFFVLGYGPCPCFFWPCKFVKYCILKPICCCCPAWCPCNPAKSRHPFESSDSSLDSDDEEYAEMRRRRRKKNERHRRHRSSDDEDKSHDMERGTAHKRKAKKSSSSDSKGKHSHHHKHGKKKGKQEDNEAAP